MKTVGTLKKNLSWVILLGDLILIHLAYNVGYFLRIGSVADDRLLNTGLLFIMGLEIFILYIFNTYDTFSNDLNMSMPVRFLVAQLVTALSMSLVFFLTVRYQTEKFGGFVVYVGLALFTLFDYLFRVFVHRLAERRIASFRLLFISDINSIEHFINEVEMRHLGWELNILLPPGREKKKEIITKLKKYPIGKWNDLETALKTSWSEVVLGIQYSVPRKIQSTLLNYRLAGYRVYSLADFYELTWHKLPEYFLQDGWFIFSHGFSLLHSAISLRLKYIFDFLLALLLLLATWPIMILMIILIRLESPGPAIYKQTRSGLQGKIFTLYKFRSMYVDSERAGARWSSVGDNRVTRIGRFIRLVRLDELPQVINVLKGDMSFIGPRPERPVFDDMLEQEISYYQLRQLVKPGITGWAQVMYSYGSSVKDSRQKLEYDLYYIKNYSLLLDLEIILRTVRVVFFTRGR